jgi:hypothetical protein
MSDKPVNEKAKTIGEMIAITMHPAFRIGFLDARDGRALDHDLIVQRILSETPAGALKRLGWNADLFDRKSVEVAQYRYEEGRTLFLEYGVRCKAWGHPDFPPIAVRDFCIKRFHENRENDHGSAGPA